MIEPIDLIWVAYKRRIRAPNSDIDFTRWAGVRRRITRCLRLNFQNFAFHSRGDEISSIHSFWPGSFWIGTINTFYNCLLDWHFYLNVLIEVFLNLSFSTLNKKQKKRFPGKQTDRHFPGSGFLHFFLLAIPFFPIIFLGLSSDKVIPLTKNLS